MTENFKVKGSEVIATIKRLIKEGNVRQVVVKNSTGKKIFEIPVNAGLIGIALTGIVAALAYIIIVSADYSIEVVRKDTT